MINFTKDHRDKLATFVAEAALANETIQTQLGQNLNVCELLHTTSVNQLNNIKSILAKKIAKLEEGDEWVETDGTQLEGLKNKKELVNLIIGWKRKNIEILENEAKKKQLEAQLKELKESTKTPEDRIKEIEAQLIELEEF